MRLLRFLASPRLLTVLIPVIMILLVIGTVSQAIFGLYLSEQLFFDRWIIWAGPFPLPAMLTLMTLLFISTTVRIFIKKDWKHKKYASLLAHLSVLILLMGGAGAAFTHFEGYMVLAEGEQTAQFFSYQDRELVILKNNDRIESYPLPLQTGYFLFGPYRFDIEDFCINIDVTTLPNVICTKSEKEYETNIYALNGRLNGKDIAIIESPDQSIKVESSGDIYELAIRKRQASLPFPVHLERFEAVFYDGTLTPKSYQSEIIAGERQTGSHQVISMNNPYIQNGYAFYQSSYLLEENQLKSVLSVTYNPYRAVPYIAFLTFCLALMLSLYERRPK